MSIESQITAGTAAIQTAAVADGTGIPKERITILRVGTSEVLGQGTDVCPQRARALAVADADAAEPARVERARQARVVSLEAELARLNAQAPTVGA